jgi:hypothetical protein
MTVVTIKKGTKIVYDIESKGQSGNLTITIKKTSPDMVFTYEISGASGSQGSVTIPAKDLDSARSLNNNNLSGGNVKLNNETCLFLSRTIYAEIAMAGMNDGGTSFKANPGEEPDSFSKGEPAIKEFKINGKTTKIDVEKFYDHVDPVSGNYHYSYTILKNEDFPLILDMATGWNLHLKQMDGVDVKVVDAY